MTEYNYCPKCSKQLTVKGSDPRCDHCGISYYQNSKPCASILPIKDGKVLVGRRAFEPFKGELDIIGGFMKYGEAPEVAAIREAKEETNLDVKIIDLLGIYPDTYGNNGHATLNIHYIGEVIGGEEKAQDDISSLEWISIEQLPENEGFRNTKQ